MAINVPVFATTPCSDGCLFGAKPIDENFYDQSTVQKNQVVENKEIIQIIHGEFIYGNIQNPTKRLPYTTYKVEDETYLPQMLHEIESNENLKSDMLQTLNKVFIKEEYMELFNNLELVAAEELDKMLVEPAKNKPGMSTRQVFTDEEMTIEAVNHQDFKSVTIFRGNR